MRTHIMECNCSICDGPGVCTIQDIGAAWGVNGGSVQHSDPTVCQYYIQQRVMKLEQALKEEKQKNTPTTL